MYDNNILKHPNYLRKGVMESYIKCQQIVAQCDILANEENKKQRFIDVKQSLQKEKIILHLV